jgi:hypothetical protein
LIKLVTLVSAIRFLAFALPTDLVLRDIQRLAFAFPKPPKVIGVARLTSAFDLFPSPIRRHEAREEPVIHLPFDGFSDELGGIQTLYISHNEF